MELQYFVSENNQIYKLTEVKKVEQSKIWRRKILINGSIYSSFIGERENALDREATDKEIRSFLSAAKS